MKKINLYNILSIVFLFAIIINFSSCNKESLNDEFEAIEKSDMQLKGYSDEGPKIETIDEFAIKEISAKADEAYSLLRELQPTFKASKTIPHYVGVISNTGACPSGVKEIRYHMDCEDNKPNTTYFHPTCFKPNGLKVTLHKNIDWVVCIVNAKEYNFNSISKGAYAIFDLSFIQYLNGAAEVLIHSDDEDKSNENEFNNSSYGFTRNTNPNGLPIKEGSSSCTTSNNTGWTKMWFYYFTKNTNTTRKLPNLGFSYSVFSNFDCCNWQNQNVLRADNEDHNNNNIIRVYRQGHNPYNLPENGSLDSAYKIFKKSKNLFYYIQNASVYMDKPTATPMGLY